LETEHQTGALQVVALHVDGPEADRRRRPRAAMSGARVGTPLHERSPRDLDLPSVEGTDMTEVYVT
jgi:hypothetical protein